MKLEQVQYTARMHTTGGREGGASRSDDGRLDVRITLPGRAGVGTNPEQLFAAGWSNCFLSAVKIVAGRMHIRLPADVAIDAEVDHGSTNGDYGLAARLNISLPGMERQVAEEIAHGAHQICAYSRATRGNIDVSISVVTDAADVGSPLLATIAAS